jgi:hypothetical protein
MDIKKINKTQIEYQGEVLTLTYTSLPNGYEIRTPLIDIEMDNGGLYTFNPTTDTIDGITYNINDFITRIYD